VPSAGAEPNRCNSIFATGRSVGFSNAERAILYRGLEELSRLLFIAYCQPQEAESVAHVLGPRCVAGGYIQ